MISIVLDNSTSRVIGLDKSTLYKLRSLVCYFNMGIWLRTKNSHAARTLLIDENGFFPTGLITRVQSFLESKQILFHIVDNRILPSTKKLGLVNLLEEPPMYEEQQVASSLLHSNAYGTCEMPTGIGKTRTIKETILLHQRPTLVICPSSNLRQQMFDYLTASFGSKFVGLIDLNTPKPITIANYHAIQSKDPRFFDYFDVVIFDEYHNCFAPDTTVQCKGYSRTIEQLHDSFHSKNKKRDILIKSWNGQEFEYKKILNAWKYPTREKLLKIKIKDEDGNIKELIVTHEHKIFRDGQKTPAEELKVGDQLYVDYKSKKYITRKRLKNPKYIQYLSERATKSNLLRSKEVKQSQSNKMKQHISSGRIKAFGRGKYGNGRQLTPGQVNIHSQLEGFICEHKVILKDGVYPHWYKIDIANEQFKIAIEVDGTSHIGREISDNKKELRLRNLGWTILRIPENYSEEQLSLLKRSIQKLSMSTI